MDQQLPAHRLVTVHITNVPYLQYSTLQYSTEYSTYSSVAVSGFLPGGGEFFLEISSGGGDNLPVGGEKIAL